VTGQIVMKEKSQIDALVSNPSEGLTVELKRWIDPTQAAGIAKIAKGAMALRNRNGGYFVIGFDDVTLAPDTANEPQHVKELFHIDTIQAIVSKYASESFEVSVEWSERDGRQYPVIVIPSGVKVPVASKRDLTDGSQNLIRNGAVYIRSLSSNGIASTTEARATDWAEIAEICFDNREADVGRFIRRHLTSIDLTSLAALLDKPAPQAPTLCERSLAVIDKGNLRFDEAVKSRNFSPEEAKLLEAGFWTVGLAIDPPKVDALPTQEFLNRLASSNPRYTAWPIWHDARLSAKIENQPKVIKDAFEYLITYVSKEINCRIEFARLAPKGEFFVRRTLQDDGISDRLSPGKFVEPTLMVIRVAEAMGVAIAFAKALGYVPDQTILGFAFRWHRLSGRSLTAWASTDYLIGEGGIAQDDNVESCIQFSLDTPLSAIPQFVDDATKRLFAAFDGAVVPLSTIQSLVTRLFERRLF
jgi:hypothetical protein